MKFIHLPGRNSCDKGREDHFLQRAPPPVHKNNGGDKNKSRRVIHKERSHRRRRLFLSRSLLGVLGGIDSRALSSSRNKTHST